MKQNGSEDGAWATYVLMGGQEVRGRVVTEKEEAPVTAQNLLEMFAVAAGVPESELAFIREGDEEPFYWSVVRRSSIVGLKLKQEARVIGGIFTGEE